VTSNELVKVYDIPDVSFTDNETDTNLDDSLCPLLSKTNNFATKHVGCAPFSRAKTYGPSRC
jgi:hypothetical protein